MRKLGVAAMVGALLLTGCAPALPSVAEKCGGEDSGIFVDGEVITYMQNADPTGNAWTCLFQEVLDSEQGYAIAMSLDRGDQMRTANYNGYSVTWSKYPDTFGIVIEIAPG